MDAHSIELKYGEKSLRLQRSDNADMQVLLPVVGPAENSPDDVIAQALRHPIGTLPLRELTSGKRSAVILVSGKTRVTGSENYLPFLLAELEAGGLAPDQITIIFATGTHEAMSKQDIIRVVGDTVADRMRIIGHDCHDRRRLADIGKTRFNNRIWASTVVMKADLKVLTGRITHHYFAGFTGGSKSILPGICGFESILHNHRMVMSIAGGAEPRAVHGNIEDNPVHLDMVEAAALAQPDFIFNTVLDYQHRFQHCVAGDYISAHREGCRLADNIHRRYVKRSAELVVASCGGYPYDVNFMQAIKTIFNCAKALTPGGTLILIAECPRGINPGFFRWFAHPDFDDLDRAVLADYDLTGHNTYLIRRILRQHRIIMVTALPRDQVMQLGFFPARNIKEALENSNLRAGHPMYVVPYGGTTLLRVRETNRDLQALLS